MMIPPQWRTPNEPRYDEELVTLTKKEYEELLHDQAKLAALEAAGVDNWEWYGDAMASLTEQKRAGAKKR